MVNDGSATERNLGQTQAMDQAAEAFKVDDWKYEAFISYRHIEPDATIAAAIHNMIETFRVPKEFYVDNRRPVFRVFRDREELTATGLDDSLQEALRESKFLIVICSKRLPQSVWCLREVETFLALRGPEYVIPVLVEGEPAESFPPQLLGLTKETVRADGQVDVRDYELLAAELRPLAVQQPDFPGYAALEQSDPSRLKELTRASGRLLKTEKYRIMAAILGCSYGDLRQRAKERRTRRILALTSVLTVALLSFGVFMFQAYQREKAAKMSANQSNAALLLDSSRRLLNSGDKIKGLLVAEQAVDLLQPEMPRFQELIARHTGIMNDAVYSSSASVRTVVQTGNDTTNAVLIEDRHQLIAGFGNTEVGVWDLRNGAQLATLAGHSEQVSAVAADPAGTWFASGSFDDTVIVWSAQTLAPLKTLQLNGNVNAVRFSRDGHYLHTINYLPGGYEFRSFETTGWQEAFPLVRLRGDLTRIDLHPTEPKILACHRGGDPNQSTQLIDLQTAQLVRTYAAQKKTFQAVNPDDQTDYDLAPHSVLFDATGEAFFAMTNRGTIKYDTASGQKLFELNLGNLEAKAHMRLAQDGTGLYITDSLSVLKLDPQTGKTLKDIFFGQDAVRHFALADDNTLVAVFEKGGIGIAREDRVTESSFDYGEGVAEFSLITADGRRAIFGSRKDKVLKFADLQPLNVSREIDGQILTVSQDRTHALFLGADKYFVWDTVQNRRLYDVSPEVLQVRGLFEHEAASGRHLSNDGRYFARLYEYQDPDDVERGVWIQLVCRNLETGEVMIDQEQASKYQVIAFTPDSRELMLIDRKGSVRFYNVQSGEVVNSFEVEQGFSQTAVFSEDQRVLAINYDEGNTILYATADGRKLAQFGGRVLHLTRDAAGQLLAKGIYNNVFFTWHEVAGTTTVELGAERDALGARQSDLNDYNPQSEMLLTLVTADRETRGVLVDCRNGQVLKSLKMNLRYYPGQGYISPDGRSMTLDQFFYSEAVDPGTADYLSDRNSYKKAILYPLMTYDELRQASAVQIGSRSLTELDRTRLGILDARTGTRSAAKGEDQLP